MNKKIGIVLSGGGVRGMAHIGLLAALEEAGIQADIISGASAGALVGALYAQGHGPEDMLRFFKTTPLFHWRFYTQQKPGLLDTDKYRRLYARFFPENDFANLQKELYVATTDISMAENVFFNKGPLIQVLLASAAVPGLFCPVEIKGRFFADGGIMNNFPVEPLLDSCNVIIGSHANPVSPMPVETFTSSMKVIRRATELRFFADAKAKFPHCDYVFKPEGLQKFNMLDSRYLDAVFELGYQAAKKEIDQILHAVETRLSSSLPTDARRIPPSLAS